MFAVVMHNDDVTTMEFVVEVLVSVFGKSPSQSEAIMLGVHNAGFGIVGVYTYDIAMTKNIQTDRLSRSRSFPLRLTVVEADEGGDQ
jgi:ATP-dependent Clp protease adaptor protein ClpS